LSTTAAIAALLGGATALSAVLIAATVMPSVLAVPATRAPSRRLLDFRPVIRNRAAMGWIVRYTVHTWELSALRAWGVTFLAVVCASQVSPPWFAGPDRALHGSRSRRHRRLDHRQ
jgi:hypothetical protein